MERLLADASKLAGIEFNIDSYADIVQAIHVIQTEMDITGTTAKEAATTIEGSSNAMKASWKNVLVSFVKDNGNIKKSLSEFSESFKTYLGNVVPAVQTMLGNVWTLVQEGFTAFSENIRARFPEMMANGLEMLLSFATGFRENVGTLVDNGIEAVKNLAQGIADSLPDFIAKAPLIISQFARTVSDNMPKILAGGVQIIGTLIKGLIQSIPTLIANIPQIIQAIWDSFVAFNWLKLGKTILTGVGNGFKAMKGQLTDAAKNGLNGALEWIKSLPNQFFNWGKDMISGLANGIKSMVGVVVDSVKNVADTIRSWLHFSRPDVGPLREYEKWMPDMMKGFAKGINDSTYLIEDAISRVAETMSVNIDGEVNATGNGSRAPQSAVTSPNITIVVNASEGQDERTIAEMVADIINERIMRQKEVFE